MRPLGSILLVIMSFTILSYGLIGATNAQTETSIPPLSVKTDLPLYADGNTITVTGFIKTLNPDYPVDLTLIVRDPTGNLVTISQVTPNSDGSYQTTFIASGTFKVGGEYTIQASYSGQKATSKFNFVGGEGYTPPPPPPPDETTEPPPPPPPKCGTNQELVNGVCMDKEPTEPPPPPPPTCGSGTHLENGKCVPDEKEPAGGGCLIATAAFGSELAPQVQMLREIRDNTVLSTSSGMAFMSGFNEFYYSFSPTIADWERANPTFQEAVRITITPLLTSLSILNYVNIDSEAEMLGYGISLIILNLGMYIIAPAVVIIKLKNRFSF
ncbi:MAG TPA: CFI-box-CTERM domain-containing protein [Nitrosopumilaceae archaeon]